MGHHERNGNLLLKNWILADRIELNMISNRQEQDNQPVPLRSRRWWW